MLQFFTSWGNLTLTLPLALFQVLVLPVLHAEGLLPAPDKQVRMTSPVSAANATAAVSTRIPLERMAEAVTLVSDDEEGGGRSNYRRTSVGGSARKRSFEKEKEKEAAGGIGK